MRATGLISAVLALVCLKLMSSCLLRVVLASVLLCHAVSGNAATLEEQILVSLDQLRAVRTDQGSAAVERYNKSMDAAWSLFEGNKVQAVPILRRELGTEIAKPQPSDLVLLDIGLFLMRSDPGTGNIIARTALFRLNPQSTVIQWNSNELFEFVRLVAEAHDSRVLPLIDKAFLSTKTTVTVPQHALTLDGTLICVFLYGAYGPESERYLDGRLSDKGVATRVLEVLGSLGSPASIPDVRKVLAASPTYDTFARVTSYMMQTAGPAGRDFMLSIDPASLDDKSRNYFAKVHGDIEHASFATASAGLMDLPGDKKLADADVLARLDAMIANNGSDDRTSPAAILGAGVARDVLIAKLIEVRHRTLYRLSDEALSDLQITNALLNAVRYRPH